MRDIVEKLDYMARLYDEAGLDGALGADNCREAIAEITRLRALVTVHMQGSGYSAEQIRAALKGDTHE